jgi:hypothetical protein
MREWMRSVERKLSQAIRSGNATTIKEAQAELNKVKGEILAQVGTNEIPTAPIEFVVQTSLYVNGVGQQRGNFYVSFPPVTLSTTAKEIAISHYELWGRDETGKTAAQLEKIPVEMIQSSTTPQFVHTNLTPGSNWRYRIRAVPLTSPVPGNFGADIAVTIAVDTTPPPIPKAPVVTARLGSIIIEWDGKTSTNVAQPADYAFTEIAFGATTSPTTLIPFTFQGAGITTLSKVNYGPYHVRLRSVDTSGNRSAWSANVSGELTPLVTGDISGLDTTFQQQVDRIEQAEADALAAAQSASTAQGTATAAQTAADAAKAAADAAQADATALQTRANELQAAADAAKAIADQAALDAAAAQTAANEANASAQERMDALQAELDAALGSNAQILRQEDAPTAEYQRSGVLWIKDSTGESYTWDDATSQWKLVENPVIAQMALDADAAADAAAAAQAAAQTAQTNASNAQNAATTAQNAASGSASQAAASATAANQAKADADAAALAAQQSADAAAASQAAADQAAQDAGASSAEALLAREAAEDAQVAADLARVQAEKQVEAIRLQGHNLVFDGGFETPSNWAASAGTSIVTTQAHTGLRSMRLAPAAANAWPVSKWIDINATGHTFRVGAWWKRESGTESLTYSVGYVVQVKTQPGGTASHVGAWAPNVQTIPDSNWVYIYVDIKATTANIVGVRFAPWVRQSANVYLVDNIEAYDISEATSALEAAAAAQAAASAAHGRADSAYTNAQNALNAASHNAKNLFSTSPPSGSAPVGTIWVQTDSNGKALSSWQQTAGTAPAADGTGGTLGSTWTPRPIRSEMIENVDVAKLTGQFIDSSHINTETLTVSGGGTLGGKLTSMDGATSSVANKVSNVTDASGNLLASKVSGTLSAGNIPNLEFSKVNGLTGLDATLNAIKARQESWQASDVTFIDGGKLYNDSVTTLQLAANAVTAEIIAAGAVGAAEVSAVSIWADNAWLNAVRTSELVLERTVGEYTTYIRPDGVRIERMVPGFDLPFPVVDLLAGSPNVFANYAADGSAVSAISADGSITGLDLAIANDPVFMGQPLIGSLADFERDTSAESPALLDNLARGIVGWMVRPAQQNGPYAAGVEFRMAQVNFPVKPNRTYRITVKTGHITAGDANVLTHRLRYTWGNTTDPDHQSPEFRKWGGRSSGIQWNSWTEPHYYNSGTTDNTMRLLYTITGASSFSYVNDWSQIEMWVEDIGPEIQTTGYARGGSSAEDAGAGGTVTPISTYTATWAGTGFKSYYNNGANQQAQGQGSTMLKQGRDPWWASGGLQTSLFWITGNSIAPASSGETGKSITGAVGSGTITKAVLTVKSSYAAPTERKKIRLYWHGSTSAPATFNPSTNFIGEYWINPGATLAINLPSSVFASIKSGALKGFGFSAAGNTNDDYLLGLSWSTKPTLKLTYKR